MSEWRRTIEIRGVQPSPHKNCIVKFYTKGWSNYFEAYLPEDYESVEHLLGTANRLIPASVREHDGNSEVIRLEIYRMERRVGKSYSRDAGDYVSVDWKKDDKEILLQEEEE